MASQSKPPRRVATDEAQTQRPEVPGRASQRVSEPKRRRFTREQRVAYHEAGHAVLYFNLKHVPAARSVTIVPAGDVLGSVEGALSASTPEELSILVEKIGDLELHHAIDHALTWLAGPEAERQLTGRYNHQAARSDYERLDGWLRSWCDEDQKETDAFARWLRIRCDRLVRVHWGEIKAVAEALLERKTLTGRQIARVIRAERERGFQKWKNGRAGTSARGGRRT